MYYVMEVCDHVKSITLLFCMAEKSFVLVALTILIDSELNTELPDHTEQVLISIFDGEKNPILQSFCFITSFLTHFNSWCKLHLKIGNFCFLLKQFLRKLNFFFFFLIFFLFCSFMRNLELILV